jgi:hypothetical protein
MDTGILYSENEENNVNEHLRSGNITFAIVKCPATNVTINNEWVIKRNSEQKRKKAMQ